VGTVLSNLFPDAILCGNVNCFANTFTRLNCCCISVPPSFSILLLRATSQNGEEQDFGAWSNWIHWEVYC
jgi:hypothetical protein